jgi:AcrR family transcriptional regulator
MARPRAVKVAAGRQASKRQASKRDSILEAALTEFSARGFAAARLDDVARRAGVAKGTIYLYFRDKDDLFQELVRSALTPVIGSIEALHNADMPAAELADRITELFVSEILETRRKDIIRLMIAEGRRFPKLAEFYYREVLSRIFAAMRSFLQRGAERGDIAPAVARFPHIVAAPGLVVVVWRGLFARPHPIHARAMMKAHLDMIFSSGRPV